MQRTIKKILNKKLGLIICVILLVLYVFMASAYSILKTKLNINGTTYIKEEKWQPKLSFVKTGQLENTFFYEIIIENQSNLTCYEWQLEIEDTGYIAFPFGIDAVKQDNIWVMNNSIWDNRIERGGRLIVNITFQVTNVNDSMTVQEYADYFVKNYIKINANTQVQVERQGKIITNGNASLTLSEEEQEIKDFIIEENKNYIPTNVNEKQYILTIYNKLYNKISKIRANIYFGNATLLGISPSEFFCDHKTNANFQVPIDIELEKEESVSVYITINVEDKNFVPDAVVAALVE